MQSEQINELAGALAKAQGTMKSASKDGLNPHFKSKYATLDSIWEAIKEPLSQNGLSISQLISQESDTTVMTTLLMHSSGQWIRSTVPVIAGKPTPQALGSSISYMRRYSLAAIVGVTVGDDDDASEAQSHYSSPPQRHYQATLEQASVEYMSEAQKEQIESLLIDDQQIYNNLLSAYKVKDLMQIPAKHYDSIIRNIKTKKAG